MFDIFVAEVLVANKSRAKPRAKGISASSSDLLERQIADARNVENPATALIAEITLAEQPTGKQLGCRIITRNKASEGLRSNTEMVVL